MLSWMCYYLSMLLNKQILNHEMRMKALKGKKTTT